MGKIKDNPRVIVEPRRKISWYSLNEQEQESECETIVEQIKRHVDDITDVYIDYDYICEFCHIEWKTDKDGCPICCEKAAEEWEKNKKASQK